MSSSKILSAAISKRNVIWMMLYCWLSPGSSAAATYYVSKTGTNSNPCSATAPCLTIKKAVSLAVSPGDLVIVKAGTYSETVSGWSSGAAGKSITVKANPGDNVVWRGGDSVLSNVAGAIFISNESYIRIEGFLFDGTVNRATIRVLGPVDAKDKSPNVIGIEIVNNVFTNNGNDGTQIGAQSRLIYLQGIGKGSSYLGPTLNSISGNRFDGNYGADIWMSQSSDTLIADNVSLNLKSSQSGPENGNAFLARSITLGDGSNRNVIMRNNISSMSKETYVTTKYSAEGLRLDARASYNTFQDNIVHDLDFASEKFSASGIYGESECNYNTYQHNIVYNIGGQGIRDGSLDTNSAIGSRFLSNTVYNCTNSGLNLTNNKNSIVKNNLFVNNGQAQVYVSSKSVTNGGHVFKNNNYFQAGKSQIASWNGADALSPVADKTLAEWVQLSGETHALSVNPQFINPPTDFHLRSTSPARGAGEDGINLGAYPFDRFTGLDLLQRLQPKPFQGQAVPTMTIDILQRLLTMGLGYHASRPFVNSAAFPLLRNNSPWVAPSEAPPRIGQAAIAPSAYQPAVTESQPIDPSKLEEMSDVLASRKTSSILIVKDNWLVTEWYAPGFDATQKQPVGALADVLVTGMSLLVALNDGRISLEDLASKFVPRWQDDPSKSQIRIVHLASHTSGIEDAFGPEQWKEAFRGSGPDAFRVVFEEAPGVFLPGAIKAYSRPGIAALNYAVTSSLMGTVQPDVLTLLRERIMRPIGVQDREWSIGQNQPIELDGMKLYSIWAGASYSPRAIAQIGRLMLRRGKWNGMQLVTSSSISQMVPPPGDQSAPGLFWWTNADRKWPSLPRDSFAGVGGGHQVLLVVPSLNLVVVRTGKSLSDGGDFWGTLEEYLFEPLMNALH